MIETTKQWMTMNAGWLSWLGGLSILTIILSMIIVPILVVRMQPDYFMVPRNEHLAFKNRHPIFRWLAKVTKNLVGAFLVFGGILMCVLPGQGLLTILVGLAVMDFPGKQKIEVWLIRRKPINWAINKMREKADRPPLIIPDKKSVIVRAESY